MTRGKKHTRREIIEALKKGWEEGEDLRVIAVQKGKYRWAYRSHRYEFTNWLEALEAAGLTYEMLQQRVKERKKAAYLQELRHAYHVDKIDLAAIALQKGGKPNSGLYYRGKEFFSGKFFWEETLVAAGLPVDKIVRQRRWDKARIKRELLKLRDTGAPLNAAALPVDLIDAIYERFESSDDALWYSGFKKVEIRKIRKQRAPYTPLEIIAWIIKRHATGKDLNESAILKARAKIPKRYVNASQTHFDGGWPEAVNTAGIDYQQYRKRKSPNYWNTDRILEAIAEMERQEEPLNHGYASSKHLDVTRAAYRCIGSWNEALEAYGIDPLSVRVAGISLSKDEIIAAIKDFVRKEQDLSFTGMQATEKTRSVYNQGFRKFICWENAIIAAELSYEKIRRVRGEYTLKELYSMMKAFEADGVDLTLQEFRKVQSRRRICNAVYRRFDSWGEFLDSAGIDSSLYHTRVNWHGGEGVLKYLKEHYPAGVVTGASKDRNFSAAVLQYFDDLPSAVAKADLIYSKSGQITKAILEDPKNQGILYRCNADFLESIAKKVFFGSKARGMMTLEISDFVNDAFIKFIEVLLDKPPKKGIRQFSFWPIRNHLAERNKAIFQEVLLGEEVYLDVFGSDVIEENDSYE